MIHLSTQIIYKSFLSNTIGIFANYENKYSLVILDQSLIGKIFLDTRNISKTIIIAICFHKYI